MPLPHTGKGDLAAWKEDLWVKQHNLGNATLHKTTYKKAYFDKLRERLRSVVPLDEVNDSNRSFYQQQVLAELGAIREELLSGTWTQ